MLINSSIIATITNTIIISVPDIKKRSLILEINFMLTHILNKKHDYKSEAIYPENLKVFFQYVPNYLEYVSDKSFLPENGKFKTEIAE